MLVLYSYTQIKHMIACLTDFAYQHYVEYFNARNIWVEIK